MDTPTELTIDYILNELKPCEEAVEWLKTQTDIQTAWQNCRRGDWMLWLLERTGQLTSELDLEIQLMALNTPLGDGHKVIDLITNEHSLAFIALKRKRLCGEFVSDEDWAAAESLAWDVARDAARAAARVADSAAAWAVASAADSAAAWAAASAAASAAARVADSAAAWAADWAAASAWQAEQLRRLIPMVELNI